MALNITPSTTQTITNENWLRSYEVTESALAMPEVYKTFVQAYGKQDFSMDGLSKILGGSRTIANMAYRHAEENFIHEYIQCEAQSAGSTNAATTCTITAAYEYSSPEDAPAAPYISTAQQISNPLIDNQVIEFPNGVQAVVSAVDASAGTFVATPKVLGTAIPEITSADIIIITGNQVGDGAFINKPRSQQPIWYHNNMMNSNGSYSATGNTMAEVAWMKFADGYGYFLYGQMTESKRIKNEREMQLMTSKKTTNTTFANASGNSTNISTEGMIPFIENYGNVSTYNAITGLTLVDFENVISTQLVPNMGAAEYACFAGINTTLSKDGFIRAEMKQGGVSYNTFNGSSEQAVNLQFNTFSLGGKTFHWKHYDLIDYKKTLGASGHRYKNLVLLIPTDKADRKVDFNDMSVTMNVPMFNVVYQSGNGYSREWEEYKTGGAHGTYTKQQDVLEVNFQTTYGFEGFAPNRYAEMAKG